MYAYTCESWACFFGGVCAPGHRSLFSCDPYHPPFANGCMLVPCLATLTAANIYSPLQYLVLAISRKAGALGILRPHRGEAMRHSGFELRRTNLARIPVNNGKERARASIPRPS